MSRLLAPSGEVVMAGGYLFTLTACDPAGGLYLGMGHKPETGDLTGRTPAAVLAAEPIAVDQLLYTDPGPAPALGPIARQNACGVCGRLRRPLRRSVMETAKAQIGPAYLLTTTIPREVWKRPGVTTEDFVSRLYAVPVEITGPSAGGVFYFTGGPVLHGMSGSPIIQNGRLVGAVYGHLPAKPDTRIGRDIEAMANSLLGTEARGDMSIGGWHIHPGQSGKHRSRTAQAKRNAYSFQRSRQVKQITGRTQQNAARYRALADKAPEMKKLEALVRRYETARQGQRQSYLDALKRLWAYQAEKEALLIRSWATAGAITQAQYRAIVKAGGHGPV